MKQKNYLRLLTATIAIVLMSIAGNMAFGFDILPCASVLATGSILFSVLSNNSYSFVASLVPSVFEIKSYGYGSKRLPSRTNRFNNRAGTCYESDAEKEDREKKEKEQKVE